MALQELGKNTSYVLEAIHINLDDQTFPHAEKGRRLWAFGPVCFLLVNSPFSDSLRRDYRDKTVLY